MPSVSDYKCPSCGAPLSYTPGENKLTCSNCQSTFALDYLKTLNDESGEGEKDEGVSFDWGSGKDGIARDTLEGTVVYQCESCGAEIEVDVNTVATKCPYCDNNVVIDDRVKGGLKPNAIIPFKITKKDLPNTIRSFYKNKRLLPGGFFSDNRIGKAQGVYVPFWLFDCDVDGRMVFNAQVFRTYVVGDYSYNETSFFRLERDGSMSFANVPVDASVKMDNDLMDSLEPYDFSELVDFDSAYLAGYVADRFDSDPDQEKTRAESRMTNSAVSRIKSTATYPVVQLQSSSMSVKNSNIRYVLLPVYLLNCEYGGKQYRYAINGQTGKVIGDLPISREKCLAWFGGAFAAVFAIVNLVSMLLA